MCWITFSFNSVWELRTHKTFPFLATTSVAQQYAVSYCTTHFQWGSGLQVDQSNTHTLYLRSHDVVPEKDKRRCLDGSIWCSKACRYFSALMVPSQMCILPTNTSIPSQMLVYELCSGIWMFVFLFSPEDTTSTKHGPIRPKHIFGESGDGNT